MYNNITGIILSGGKSTRMGLNKSLLKIGERTIIERTTELMKGIFSYVLLVTNTPEEYKFLGLEIFEDIYKNVGPLAGIHSGLVHSATEINFVISCDMPFVDRGVIDFIINYKTDKLITITKADGFVQQLCGLYSKKVLTEIEKIIQAERIKIETDHKNKCGCKVFQLVQSVDTKIIDITNEYDSYKDGMFLNMNKPEDFDMVKKMFLQNNH